MRQRNQVVAAAAVIAAAGVLTWAAGPSPGTYIWPLAVALLGAGLIWRQAYPETWRRMAQSGAGQLVAKPEWVRGAFGGLLVISGLIGFLAARDELRAARPGLAAAGIILLGLGVIGTPWLLRLVRELDAERQERGRRAARDDIAARMHDSVLHSLALIQRSAADPHQVQRLARSAERELRTWLDATPEAAQTRTLSTGLAKVAAEVEDAFGVPIEVVRVGEDLPLGERTLAALQAGREAMLNAASHSGAPGISVYAEAEPDRLSIFVRDRGKGFSLDDIPPDRLGVRQAIIGRMDRAGGTALIRSAPGEGTEVEIQVSKA
jgi:signal transduction histidine kinase